MGSLAWSCGRGGQVGEWKRDGVGGWMGRGAWRTHTDGEPLSLAP